MNASAATPRLEGAGHRLVGVVERSEDELVEVLEHGTTQAYIKSQCRCEVCARAKSERDRRLERLRAEGRSMQVDAEPARNHVRRLMDAGMTAREISRESGVPRSSINALLYGNSKGAGGALKRITRRNAERLFQVKLKASPRKVIDASTTNEYLTEMLEIGIGKVALSTALHGKPRRDLKMFPTCTIEKARKVEELHWALWRNVPELRRICKHKRPAYLGED